MPRDDDHGDFVWINAEMIYDRRVRQLGTENGEFSTFFALVLQSGAEDRRGWLPYGEPVEDFLNEVARPRPDERFTHDQAEAMMAKYESLELAKREGDRVVILARDLVSYDDDPDEIRLMDYARERRRLRNEEGLDI